MVEQRPGRSGLAPVAAPSFDARVEPDGYAERARVLLADLRDSADPTDAWERLAARALIPSDAVDDPGRAFGYVLTEVCRRQPPGALRCGLNCPTCRGRGMTDRAMAAGRPSSVALAVGLAAAFPEVLRAEALARELAARVAPFGAPALAGCVWRLRAPGAGPGVGAAADYPFDGAWWRAARALVENRTGAHRARVAGLPFSVANVVVGPYRDAWRDAAAAAAVVPPGAPTDPPARRALHGRRLATLPNPFEPLAELCAGLAQYERVDASGQLWLTLPEF